MGNQALHNGDWNNAITFCSKALPDAARIPNNEDQLFFIHAIRAEAFFNIGNYEQAFANADVSVKFRPNWQKVTILLLIFFYLC